MSHLKGFPDLPPIWFAMFVAAIGLVDHFSNFGNYYWSLSKAFGFGTILLAVLLIVWAALWFLKMRTPIEPDHVPKNIITKGPFKFSRNPINLAMAIALIGVSLLFWNMFRVPVPVPVHDCY